MINKISLALRCLQDGQPFTINGLRLEPGDVNSIIVTAWSQYLNFPIITKAIAIKELSEIKDALLDLMETSDDLRSFLSNKSIEYLLCYHDGGKASIALCSEKNDILKWRADLKP